MMNLPRKTNIINENMTGRRRTRRVFAIDSQKEHATPFKNSPTKLWRIEEFEDKSFEEMKPAYRSALMTRYQNLVIFV